MSYSDIPRRFVMFVQKVSQIAVVGPYGSIVHDRIGVVSLRQQRRYCCAALYRQLPCSDCSACILDCGQILDTASSTLTGLHKWSH